MLKTNKEIKIITKEEYIKLIALIINLRDEAVNYGQRLYEANSGAWFNEEAFKYSEKQMEKCRTAYFRLS